MITARPITTRYDTAETSPVTVATPSCCCCCCCIGTAAAVITFNAKKVSNEKKASGGNAFAPWMAGLALPIAFGSLFLAENYRSDAWTIALFGILTFVATYAVAYQLAGGSNPTRAVGTPVLVLAVAALAAAAELIGVLFTSGVGWIVIIPLYIWAAYRIANIGAAPKAQTASFPAPPGQPVPGWTNYQDPLGPPAQPSGPAQQLPPVAPPVTPRPPDLDFWQPPSQQEDDSPPSDPSF